MTKNTKIIFVRHGHSVANLKGIFGGRIDVELTETGIAQAKAVSEYILKNYKIDKVYSSTLQRAWKTAEIIASPHDMEVTRDCRLCEIYGGDWEGLFFDEIEKKYPEEFEVWRNDLGNVQTPNGENLHDVQKRGLEAVFEIAHNNSGKTVLIVAHRVLLITLQCFWENRDIEDVNECEWLSNCSVSEVEITDDKIVPINIGQDEFLADLITKVETKM